MKLTLQTVSPVHIGSGKVLEPFDYFINNSKLYRINPDKAFSILYDRHKDFSDVFSSWLDKMGNKIIKERDNREQAKLRLKFNLLEFARTELRDAPAAEMIKRDAVLYAVNLPSGMQARRQISEIIRDGKGRIFIPGSSIKGALRTALLWDAFKKANTSVQTNILQVAYRKIEEKIAKEQKPVRRFPDLDSSLAENFLICGEQKNGKVGFTNIQYDLMKFITVTDAYPEQQGDLLSAYPVNLYLRAKEPQTQTNVYELINPNIRFNFEIKLDVKKISEIYKNKQTTWQKFGERFNNVFGMGPEFALTEGFEEKVIKNILGTVAQFGSMLIERERKWIAGYKEAISDKNGRIISNPSMDEIRGFYNLLNPSYSLLRFGWGAGFPATTIYDAVTSKLELVDIWGKIGIKLKLGATPNQKSENGKPYEYSLVKIFPASKRMVAGDNRKPIFPVGWAVILSGNQTFADTVVLPTTVAEETETHVVPEAIARNAAEIKKTNDAKKLKPGDLIEAKVVRITGSQVTVEVLHSLSVPELSFKYGNSSVLKDKKYLMVKISSISKEKIAGVAFGKFIDHEITE